MVLHMADLREDRYRAVRNAYFVALPLAGVAILFLAPEEFAELTPAWSGFVQFMMRLVPGIPPLVQASMAPAATASFLAVAWSLVPLMTWLNVVWRVVEYRGSRKRPLSWKSMIWLIVLFGLPLQMYLGLDLGDVRLPLTNFARIVLGVSGALLFWFISALLSVQCLMLTDFVRNSGRFKSGSTP